MATINGNTQVTVFRGSGASHAAGVVPDPGAVAGVTRFLREDGSWATIAFPAPYIPPTTVDVATTTGALVLAAGNVGTFRINLTQNVTSISITGLVDGQKILFVWKQNALGPWTVALPATFIPNGSISNAASTQTLMEMFYDAASGNLLPRAPASTVPSS